uniref:Sugar kinase, ribokinase family n=1 Tax=mine drainage metagenome TaxID=410659 RepID=E6QKF2_9ZZZZ
MSITVVGSVAFDSIETPAGRRERCLGGAATYFSLAASYFTAVRVIAVVGEDFTTTEECVFTARSIDLRGLERAAGKSFFWAGNYLENLNEAKTEQTDLNVFASFNPRIPEAYRDSEFLFLANIDPVLQKRVREAMPQARLVCGDTMNYWINDHRPALLDVLPELDVLLINDTETRLLSGKKNPVQAAHDVLALGPKALVVKHGEYGATAFFGANAFEKNLSARHPFRAPGLPLAEVVDPTGAGDSFAGGFFGYIASQPELTPEVFRRAMFYGSVMGSFTVERFGTERLQQLTREEIDARFQRLRELTHLD